MMKKFALSLAVAGGLAGPMVGCTQTETTVGGAIAGGLIGAAVGDVEGALIGAAAGAVAGALIGRAQDGRCYYANGRGGYYKAACR